MKRSSTPHGDVTRPVTAGRPVPSRRALVAVWLVAAVGFAMLLVVAQRREGPLDDPDQAEQRVGFVDEGSLPSPAPIVVSDLPARGRPTVVVFLRPASAARACRDVAHAVARAAAVVVVLSGPALCAGASAVQVDPSGRMSQAYGMRVPADGGPPVGYAVVDAEARLRYRTLDPDLSANTAEMITILDAL